MTKLCVSHFRLAITINSHILLGANFLLGGRPSRPPPRWLRPRSPHRVHVRGAPAMGFRRVRSFPEPYFPNLT